MNIGTAYLALAAKIQESAMAMCHDDIRTRLSDALRAMVKDTGSWAYLVAVFGDDKAGDVVYSVNSDLKKAPYTMTTGGAVIDSATAVDVSPLTTYETETVQATEAGARNSSRDLKQLQSIHDASIGMGAMCAVKESKAGTDTGIRLVESAACFESIVLKEARADYEIKLIAPGKGSSAFYPKEVLQRDGPKVFKAGTHVYVNHPTLAEEAARPEGDVKNLAGVLTTDAVYHESHAKGPGLYGRMKVFADHGQMVEEKAAHVGMSIRASGVAESGGKLREGVPVLARLTRAESVDVVTHAGAGGMILTESAKTSSVEGGLSEMDQAEIKKLQESLLAQTAINDRLVKRALRGDAIELATAVLSSTQLNEAARKYITETVVGSPDSPRELPVKESGILDAVKLTEAVNAEAKRYAAALPPAGRVSGMGGAPGPQLIESDPVKIAAREAANKREQEDDIDSMARLMGGDRKLAEAAVKGRAA